MNMSNPKDRTHGKTICFQSLPVAITHNDVEASGLRARV